MRKLSSSTAPSCGAQAPPAFSLPRFFPLVLPGYMGAFLSALGISDLPALSWCSVKIVLVLSVVLMYLWLE